MRYLIIRLLPAVAPLIDDSSKSSKEDRNVKPGKRIGRGFFFLEK